MAQFNHGVFWANAEVENRLNTKNNATEGFSVMVIVDAIKDEEVRISYGQRTTEDLLLYYGFAPEVCSATSLGTHPPHLLTLSPTDWQQNPADKFVLKVQLSSEDPTIALKGLLLEQLGIPPGLTGFELFADGRLSQSLSWSMRILAMTEEELKWLKAQKANSHAELEKRLPGEVVYAGLDTIVAVCQDVLDKYPTSEDEDTKVLQDKEALPQGSAKRAAVALRRGEKFILHATIRTAKRKIAEMQPAKKAEL